MILTYDNFLQCELFYEPLRASHRAAVTNNHTLTTIKDIIEFYKQPGIIDKLNKEYSINQIHMRVMVLEKIKELISFLEIIILKNKQFQLLLHLLLPQNKKLHFYVVLK